MIIKKKDWEKERDKIRREGLFHWLKKGGLPGIIDEYVWLIVL